MIKIAQTSLILVYLVILAGSVVRSSGAGMGCPDWPKCFGTWIPPTHASQLPPDYKTRYAEEHNAVQDFNAVQTWTEYVNRLLGAILGIAIFIQLIFAFKHRKTDKWLLPLAFLMFLAVGFQGWLGARVVASNLAPLKITIHLIGALVIVTLGVFILYRLKKDALLKSKNKRLAHWFLLGLGLSFVQFLMGILVRQEVDVWLDHMTRSALLASLHESFNFLTHARFSVLLLAFNAWLLYKLWKTEMSPNLRKMAMYLGTFLSLELLVGVTLSWFGFPAFAQPMHLLLATLVFTTQLWLYLGLKE